MRSNVTEGPLNEDSSNGMGDMSKGLEDVPDETFSRDIREHEEVVSRWAVVRAFDRHLASLENVAVTLAGVAVVVMILSVSYGVIGRKVFGLATAWTLEISEYSLLFVTFLAAPWVLRLHGHVNVDIVIALLNENWHRRFRVATYSVAAVAAVVLFYFAFETTLSDYSRDVVLRKVLEIPQWMIVGVIPVGSLLLSLRLICQVLTEISRRPTQ